VLGQHANTPNGIIPWPGDHRKSRLSQWGEQQHNNASLYNNGGGDHFPGNRSSGVLRSSSRGPTYFSPQHNHVSHLRRGLARVRPSGERPSSVEPFGRIVFPIESATEKSIGLEGLYRFFVRHTLVNEGPGTFFTFLTVALSNVHFDHSALHSSRRR